MAVQTAEAKIKITAEITDLEKKLQQAFALWKIQQEAMGRSTAEANLKMAGGLNTVTKAMQTASDQTGVLTKEKEKLTKAVEQAHGGFRIFGMNIVDIAAKLYIAQVAIRNVIGALEGLFQFAELGAKVEQASISFDRLQKYIGFNADLMDRLREASRGLMTDYELQNKTAAALAGTQGRLSKELAEALPSLLQYALAIKTLRPEIENADLVYQKLLLGIRRGSPRLIDDANIVIKVSGAYDEYAKSIGKTTDELTAEEQQLAILHEVQRGGNVLLEQAGINIEALTDRYGRLRTNLEETHQIGGVFLNEFLGPSIDLINEQFGAIDKNIDRWAQFGETLSPIATLLVSYMLTVQKVSMALWDFLNPVNELIEGITDLNTRFNILKTRADDISSTMPEVASGIDEITDSANNGADAADKFGDAWENALLRVADQQASSQRKWRDAVANTSSGITDEIQKLEEKLSDIHGRAADQRINVARFEADRRTNIDETYYDHRADLERRIQELIEGEAETEKQKELRGIQRQIADPGIPEKYRIYLKLRAADLEGQIEEERKQRQIQGLRDELTRLDQKHAEEIEKLERQSGERLAIINKTEEDATAKAGEESRKRLKGWTDDLMKLSQSIQTNYKEAWLDAMISVSEKGSDLNRMLEDQRLRVKGLSDETIKFYRDLEDFSTISGAVSPLGMAILAARLGIIDYTQIPIPIPLGAHPGRQHGGSVMSGHPYLVGEAGPELFVPSAGGAIVPNTMFGGGMSVTVQAGAFLGSNADAVRLGNQLIPIIAKGLQSYNLTPWSLGSRRTGTQ